MATLIRTSGTTRTPAKRSSLFTLAVWILGAVALLMTVALFQDATHIYLHDAGLPPFRTLQFPLGTDDLGRNLLARLSVGAQISMTVGLSTAVVASLAGSTYGLIAAMNEGPVDDLLMRGVDILYSLPGLMIVVLLSVFIEPYFIALLPPNMAPVAKLVSLVIALSFFSWPEAARLIRGQALYLKRQDFVDAYRSLGGGTLRLVMHHFLPNLAPYMLISIMVAVPRAILTESTLSFMGLGMEAPLSSWGTLVSEGWFLVRTSPHIVLEASLAIGASMWAMNMVIQQLKSRWHIPR